MNLRKPLSGVKNRQRFFEEKHIGKFLGLQDKGIAAIMVKYDTQVESLKIRRDYF